MSLTLLNKVQRLKKIKAERAARRQTIKDEEIDSILPKDPLELLPHTPDWALEFFKPARFKAVYSGRAGGKSHLFAEMMLARMICDPGLRCVCIRKYRATLTNSVMLLLKNKIDDFGWEKYFDIQQTQIKRKGGRGFIAFIGMQDHNASSIKGYESFKIAWTDEATELDDYSLSLLIPTLRAANAENWFTWNPDQESDPIDAFFRGANPPKNSIVKQISFEDNPFLTQTSKDDEERDRLNDPDKHNWIWLGGYNLKSDAIVFSGKWKIGEFTATPTMFDGPYYGADWGFGSDPTAAIRCWIRGKELFIDYDSREYRLELDDTARKWIEDVPDIEKHIVKADNSRPESISHVRRGREAAGKDKGCPPIPRLVAAKKWPGSVRDGIEFIKNYKIIVHPRCKATIEELKLYRHKTNKANEVLPEIVDKNNHCLDSLRYALSPLIRNQKTNSNTPGILFTAN